MHPALDDDECVDRELLCPVRAASQPSPRAPPLRAPGHAAGNGRSAAAGGRGGHLGRLDDGRGGRATAACTALGLAGDDRDDATVQRRSASSNCAYSCRVDSSEIRGEALHLRGVDNLSTDDIKLYLSSVSPDIAFVKLEWIDDTSLNIVYESDDIAATALQTVTAQPVEQVTTTTLRPAKSLQGDKVIAGLKVRVAFLSDKKERGARDRSRWYLFNPHPTEEYDRRCTSPVISVLIVVDGIHDGGTDNMIPIHGVDGRGHGHHN